MKFILSLIFILFSFSGCGENSETTPLTESSIVEPQIVQHIATPQIEKTITIYIHGYSKSGYKREAVYGSEDSLEKHADVVELVGFSTRNNSGESELKNNLFLATNYYGDEAPDYYTEEDIKELEEITALHGGGIPRYALIVAKYAKHIMAEENVTKVNFLSASMGSLVTRWMIENNAENLASEKKIGKWLSFEGVIRGNYPASSSTLVNLAEFFEEQSPDVEHMSYDWIDKQFSSRAIGDSAYYKDIMLGFETSTDDDLIERALSSYLLLNGNYHANDGYQLARDTYFEINNTQNMFNNLPPTHTYFHENHLDLADHKAAWAGAVTFLTSKKRVRITLTKATVSDIHEERKEIKVGRFVIGSHDFRPAEIVFESSVTSPNVDQLWGITDAIDKRALSGGALAVHKYQNHGDSQVLNQELFNDFVTQDETTLSLNVNAHEIDFHLKYNKEEITGHKTENLGAATIDIPLENGTHQISANDWSGEVKVEIFEY